MSEEEADCCPLCMEELDLTDKTFDACRCGYQVCLWCWHQIKNEYNALCPACRAPYSELAKSKGNVDREDVVRRTKQRKQKEKIEKKAVAPPKAAPINRKSLVNVRVMQRNLVYVIGLPVHYADDEMLRSKECFGQYGRIVKAVVNKSHLNTDRNNATASAYITFAHKADAQNCIDLIDGYVLDGSLLRASFGTTKYCNFFLRNLSCNNPECLYLHELGETDDSFTKEEMQTAGKGCFREIGPYEDRRGNAFPHLTPAMREALGEGKAPVARPTVVSSDAQRKAQSAAAISKLKQHTESDTKTRPTQPEYTAAPAPASSASSTSPPSPHNTQTDVPAKPVLYVDTSKPTTAPLPPPATSPTTADEPLWAQSFPRVVTQAPNEPPQRPIHHVFSPFGMGFDGGIGRVHHQQGPQQPSHQLSAPPALSRPPPPPPPPPSSADKAAHVSAWSFDPLFSDIRQAPVSPPHPSPPPHSVFEFAAVDSAFTPRNESSEALAGLLGVQLSAKPLLSGSMLPPPGSATAPPTSGGKRGSRFSFANTGGNEPTPSQPSPMMEDYNPFGGMYRSPEKLFDGSAPVSAASSSGAFALSMGPADTSLSGLAFLQQMLPNVNISYGREPSEQHLHRPAYTQSFEQKSSWTNGLDNARTDDPFWARQGSSFDAPPPPPPPSYSFHDPAIVQGGGAFGGSSFYQDDLAPQQQQKPFGRSYASPQHNINTGRS